MNTLYITIICIPWMLMVLRFCDKRNENRKFCQKMTYDPISKINKRFLCSWIYFDNNVIYKMIWIRKINLISYWYINLFSLPLNACKCFKGNNTLWLEYETYIFAIIFQDLIRNQQINSAKPILTALKYKC